MNFVKSLSKIQIAVFALLICMNGVLGYLFYNQYRTNIQNRELIADSKIENKDLSQDLDIMKDKYDRLKTEVDVLKNKVTKVSYKKKYHKKKKLYSAGKKGKKYSYKRYKVNYKKLYFQLKRECYNNGMTRKYKR